MEKPATDVLGKHLETRDYVLFPTGTGYILGVVAEVNPTQHPRHGTVRVIHPYKGYSLHIGKDTITRWGSKWKRNHTLVKLTQHDIECPDLRIENKLDNLVDLLEEKRVWLKDNPA